MLRLGNEVLFELVDGKLVEKKSTFLDNLCCGYVIAALAQFAHESKAGVVLPGQTLQCFPSEHNRVRLPDITFILSDTIRVDEADDGHLRIVPSCVVEIISPLDTVAEVDGTLADYKSARIPLIWVVNPKARHIRVHRPGKPIDELHDGDTLSGDAILPGFAVNVTDLLPALAKPAPAVPQGEA
jgi:Uma2 family endonuclease